MPPDRAPGNPRWMHAPVLAAALPCACSGSVAPPAASPGLRTVALNLNFPILTAQGGVYRMVGN